MKQESPPVRAGKKSNRGLDAIEAESGPHVGVCLYYWCGFVAEFDEVLACFFVFGDVNDFEVCAHGGECSFGGLALSAGWACVECDHCFSLVVFG